VQTKDEKTDSLGRTSWEQDMPQYTQKSIKTCHRQTKKKNSFATQRIRPLQAEWQKSGVQRNLKAIKKVKGPIARK